MLDSIFKKMCEIRYFELGIIKNIDKIHCPVYLSMGQEAIAATISEYYPDFRVFPQHRGHAWYLAYGGATEALRDELLGLGTGCCRGMGGSSDIQCARVEAHHGLLGENIPLAVGYALASHQGTIAAFGDGAIEEDYAGVALGFASTHKLPILFVCEDNNLAILTEVKERRNWKAIGLAKGYKLDFADIDDNPEEILRALKNLKLPALINIHTLRHKWHVGIGEDGKPSFDRLKMFKSKILSSKTIEEDAKLKMELLWKL